ncbi:MAG: hypothetical protein FRX48_03946 [Lasallia pustulata]|uniref:Uncharacterized protein n=1 Tax=Lasallia pustulata TaxID=136370 RepID=A0A5M8PSW8_9LECA|nr:MAG: hypothetical protein FRX48_03946 [Lasallia pustulata]
MVLTTWAPALAIPLASLLLEATVTALPLEIAKGIDVSNFGLNRRQEPGLRAEDEDPAQIAAGGTNELRKTGNNNTAVKSYFISYARLRYQGCIDFLSTWSGKPLDRASTTSLPSASATETNVMTGWQSASATEINVMTGWRSATATEAAVTCYHVADPENTCAAIADGPGWCECETGLATYAVMPSPAI